VIRDQFQYVCIQIQPKALLQTSGQDIDIGLTQEITEYHVFTLAGKRESFDCQLLLLKMLFAV